MDEKVHCFERAGLGKAPFVYVGSYEDRGPKTFPGPGGVTIMVGSPGQPMGTCKYCGQGIAICCRVRSADGKEFIVGSDCIMKVGDAGLRKAVNKEKTELRHKKEDMMIAEGRAFVEKYRDKLHGRKWVAEEDRHTILESFDWYMRNAGRSGKLRMIRSLRRYIESEFGSEK